MNKLATALVFLVLSPMLGCGNGTAPSTSGGSVRSISTKANGVEYTAVGLSAFTIEVVNGQYVELSFADRKFIIRGQTVLVDGNTIAEVPAGSKSVRVEVSGKDVSIKADDKEIYKSSS